MLYIYSIFFQDRLLISSDLDKCQVCSGCGSILTISKVKIDTAEYEITSQQCISCSREGKHPTVYDMEIPRVFSYLAAELTAMNIRVVVKPKPAV